MKFLNDNILYLAFGHRKPKSEKEFSDPIIFQFSQFLIEREKRVKKKMIL
jgi:hypothetical protein